MYSQIKPNEQKITLQGIPHVFYASTHFVILNENLIFFEVLLNFWSHMD